MHDASGNTGAPLGRDGTEKTGDEKGVLFHVGLNFGRTVRFLKNGPTRLGKAAGRTIVVSVQKIGSLAGSAAPKQRETQEIDACVSSTTGQPIDDAAAASSVDIEHPTSDEPDGLAVDMDLKNLEDLIGRKKKDK